MICTETDYAGQTFKKIRLEQARLVSTEFHDCTFDRCSFAEAAFQSCRFVNCVFMRCDLSLIQVPKCSFVAVRFESSKVIGVNWTRARWSATKLGAPVSFSECAISHSTFIGLNLKRIQIRDCVAVDVDFREADLSQADFAGTDLSDSLFLGTDLAKADLSRARNYQIDPSQNIVKGTKFSLPEAISLLYNLDIILIED
ncbi:MAG: pentapeptide repeat-containing protein [Chloroflexota bacterium]|nr:pentapeptide repeat-containing protein [Chloroflexota bacterium]